MKAELPVVISSSPQFYDKNSTINMMWAVFCCLLPAALWGVFVFGPRALAVLTLSVGASAAAEFFFARLAGRSFTLWDGSAWVTGLLIGMMMPPAVALYVPVFAALFAIGVVKWTFGGLGRNWLNPAIAGRVFVFFCWPQAMSSWLPQQLSPADVVSSATPLGLLKTGMQGGSGLGPPLDYLFKHGYSLSAVDVSVTGWLNSHILEPLGLSLQQGYVDLFLGIMPGSIGEVSALLLLVSAIFLFARKIIGLAIPAAYLGSFALLVWVFGGFKLTGGFFSGDIFFHLLTGGLILGVFYMAPDIVSSPLTMRGQLIYGCGAGMLTFLLRFYGAFPDGVALAILAMNVFTPLLNRLTQPSRFGARRKNRSVPPGNSGAGRPCKDEAPANGPDSPPPAGPQAGLQNRTPK
jgi:electron transport complex protein RnfD